MAVGNNPAKVLGSDKFLPALQIMLDGYAKDDPPTRKMLPLETDVPELLVEMGYSSAGTAQMQAVGDLTLIAFYYLLRIGEYTVKSKRNNTKQTVQFKLEDVTFYKKNEMGTAPLPPQKRALSTCIIRRQRNAQARQPEKRMERGVRTPGNEWGGNKLPN